MYTQHIHIYIYIYIHKTYIDVSIRNTCTTAYTNTHTHTHPTHTHTHSLARERERGGAAAAAAGAAAVVGGTVLVVACRRRRRRSNSRHRHRSASSTGGKPRLSRVAQGSRAEKRSSQKLPGSGRAVATSCRSTACLCLQPLAAVPTRLLLEVLEMLGRLGICFLLPFKLWLRSFRLRVCTLRRANLILSLPCCCCLLRDTPGLTQQGILAPSFQVRPQRRWHQSEPTTLSGAKSSQKL